MLRYIFYIPKVIIRLCILILVLILGLLKVIEDVGK